MPRIPDCPALLAGRRGAIWISVDGEIERLSPSAAAERAESSPPIVCHARQTASLLGLPGLRAFDLLELFAFVRPAEFCLPTVRGLARAGGLAPPPDEEAAAALQPVIAQRLLSWLAESGPDAREGAARTAAAMGRAGWPWAAYVLGALGRAADAKGVTAGLDVWNWLPEWSEFAPEPPPEDQPVREIEARERLRLLLGPHAETRPSQGDYCAAASGAFLPRDLAGAPNVVLAEAGTGTGKTMGYIAPASVWAEKNGGTVWLSTFTRNLQRQIDQELDRLFPDPAAKAERVVVRKGRENYLCLLNMEEALQGGAARPQEVQALGLMARWAGATRDGDMIGGDFPAWLIGLMGPARTIQLADRRGECVFSACPHYRKCFIERSVRKARRADIVIANHALVMLQAARAGDAATLPTRYVFDEAHHLFDAADSAFSAHLSGEETLELRRWLRGGEGGRRSRARGLVRRIGDIAEQEASAARQMAEVVEAARVLPQEGWLARVERDQPEGPAEAFLARVRQQVLARARQDEQSYSLEAPSNDPVPGLREAAAELDAALAGLGRPMRGLVRSLAERLDREASELDSATRVRIEAAMRGLDWRLGLVEAWRLMLRQLDQPESGDFVDWMSVERMDGRSVDIGLHRHWIDPTRPFAEAVLAPAHGAVITSATLRDRARETEAEEGWRAAEIRTGAHHLPLPARRISVPSPFD
ncbi:MAG: ATP-dependent DNA helicase, partial [Alphaproteobacteria bacterium]|nr:ATP-dependent DNA helicase [Alphaproteobacteria bacterium]